MDDDPLQQRGGDDGDLLRHGVPEHDAPEASAAEAHLRGHAGAEHEDEGPKHGATRQHALEVLLLDDAAAEHELPQAGQRRRDGGGAGRVGEPPVRDPEALERAALEERVGEQVELRPGDVVEDELLSSLGGEHADPAPEDVLVGVAEVARQAHGAEGTRVGAHGVGDGGGDRAHVAGVAEDELHVVEDKRVGGPEPAPPGGEHRRARCLLDREEGDDAGQDVVGQAADDVRAPVGIRGGVVARNAAGSRGEAGEEPPHQA